jgi:DNA adenine methylase
MISLRAKNSCSAILRTSQISELLRNANEWKLGYHFDNCYRVLVTVLSTRIPDCKTFPRNKGLTLARDYAISERVGKSSTSFNPKWNLGATTVIRVPAALAPHLLAVARTLDEQASKVQERPGDYASPRLINAPARLKLNQPVNVASVSQLSPFRFPGGKTWLVPYVRTWLLSKAPGISRFVEPFAGGGIISLTVAAESLARQVVFAELDDDVAAVWRVVLNGQAEWLAQRILGFEVSLENVRRALNEGPATLNDKAFQTILRNRVQRGGIMAAGAGLIKAGENGRGLNSRWYPDTLARRIRAINDMKHRLNFLHGDGFTLLNEYKADPETAFFLDPPYASAARRLYKHWAVDHRKLFQQLSTVKGDFLLTYDNTPEMAALANEFEFQARPVAMKNTHHAKMTELLIGRDLKWLSA